MIIIGLAGVILIGVMTPAFLFQPVKLGKNGCPIDTHRAPDAKTVILIDQTDALPQAELDYVRRLVKNEYYWLPKGGVLSIRMIGADISDSAVRLTACRMADGSDALGIIDNPVAMRKDYDRKVGAALNAFLLGLSTQAEQVRSPIAETIAVVMSDPDFAADIGDRRLVIVSDMAQNGAAYSHYGRSRSNFSVPSDQVEALAAPFGNTAVRIHYIRRPKLALQGEAHQAFWRSYFADRGASDVAIGHDLALGEPGDRAIWYENGGDGNDNRQ